MKNLNIKLNYYMLLAIPLALAYLLGLFVPLMDEDSSHHADIALRMYLTNDYIHLVSRGHDYLDKPHLLFWLAALSYHLFGVNTIAYKLPSLLVTCLGTYSTYRLGKLLYDRETGMLAALITAASQAYILANNDVRMDALLTGFIIFATWQLVEAVYKQNWYNYVLGALGMACAFASKSIIGIAMPLVALFFLLVYQRNWKKLLDIKWLYTFLLLILFISPVLYCFYIQFDLHPEKEIRGNSGVSGIKFVLFDQSVERLDGRSFGKGKAHPFFFLHTMLWAFFPWAFLSYYAIFSKAWVLIKNKFNFVRGEELLTVGTIISVFILISSSHYQLPHYLNILFPFLAIVTAHVLLINEHTKNKMYGMIIFQEVICILYITAVILLNGWIFPVKSVLVIAGSVFLLLLIIFFVLQKERSLKKLVAISVLTVAFGNILLNGNFYPNLLKFQSGIGLAKSLKKEKIDANQVYKFNTDSYSFDFYLAKLIPEVSLDELSKYLKAGENVYVYTNKEGKQKLADMQISLREVARYQNAKVSKLKPKFLNPKTRSLACDTNYLVMIGSKTASR